MKRQPDQGDQLFDPGPIQLKSTDFPDNTVYHVGVSGGKDSAAVLLWLVHDSGIPHEKIRATFCDTGNEHAWTYDHVKLLAERIFPIETLRPELPFFEMAMKHRRFPSPCARFCTQDLKIKPSADHISKLVALGLRPIGVSGVRGDESFERSQLEEWGYNGNLLCVEWRPLIRWTLADVLAIHAKYGIPMNPLYAAGAQRVGCWPCIMSRKEEIRNIALNFPDRIDQIRAAELAFEKSGGRFSSFFGCDKIPKRFHSREVINNDGEAVTYGTIDDVVRWSLTGKNAKGSHEDEPAKEPRCMSGYCE